MPPPSPIAEQVSRGLSEGLASEYLLTLAEFNEVVRPVLADPAHWREGVEGINRFLQETRTHWNWRFVISPAALSYLRGLKAQGVDIGSVRALQARQPEAGRYYDALKERFSDGELSLAEFVPLSRDLTGADFYRGGLAGLVLALETMRKEGVEVEGEIIEQLMARYRDYIAAGLLAEIRTYRGVRGLGPLSFPVGTNRALRAIDEGGVPDGVIDERDRRALSLPLIRFIREIAGVASEVARIAAWTGDERASAEARELVSIRDRLIDHALVGRPLSIRTIITSDGRTINLDDYRSKKAVVIHLWATWCPPCQSELPNLASFYRQHKGELEVIALSTDELGSRADALAMIAGYFPSRETPFVQAMRDENVELANIIPSAGIPASLVIGRDGLVKRVLIGVVDWQRQGRDLIR